MNKKIKHIIAVTLTISAFSIIEPIKYMNLTNTVKANAAIKGADLKDISLGQGGIDFKASKTDYTLKLDSSVKELKVGAKPKETDAEVKINGTEVDETDNYKTVINLDKGENTVTIKVENGSKKKTYTITVMRGNTDEKQIYLSNISLSAGKINFSKEEDSYDVNLKADVTDVSIKATPDDNDYDVEIDGVTAYEDDNYKRTVALNNGNNEIKIRIQDDDDHEKIYTLNINRGGTSTESNTQATTVPDNTSITSTNIPISAAKGWVLNNNQWYFLDESGSKQIGWIPVNGKWYYLDSTGAMKTNWQQLNGQWYHLDSNGVMGTGWFKDANGKWYYLYDSGVMAKNTTIGGFKLDSTGTWVK